MNAVKYIGYEKEPEWWAPFSLLGGGWDRSGYGCQFVLQDHLDGFSSKKLQ